jgi:hypothetical protein
LFSSLYFRFSSFFLSTILLASFITSSPLENVDLRIQIHLIDSHIQVVKPYFDFKRPIALLLLTILTLYSTPSPLFHSICLPIFILLYRHDRTAFTVNVPVCLGLVTFVAGLGGGREGLYSSMVSASEHASMITGAVMGAVMLHHQFNTSRKSRIAWSECILFGVLWTSSSAVCREISSHVSCQ